MITPGARDNAPAPLIVTAELPPPLQSRADQLRQAHFPPERNFLKAHVTLFHALPPFCEDEVREWLATEAAGPPVPARLDGVMSLGRGVALKVHSPAMLDLHERLADRFHGLLSAQDRQRPRLHITVQNKVAPREAKALFEHLALQIEPFDFAFAGMGLHRYRGGPWETIRRWSFRG